MLYAQAWQPVVARTPQDAIRQRVLDPFERLFLEEYPKVVAIAYRVLADRSAAEDVGQALRKLPQRTAALLMLRYSGLSYAEVATALGMKVGNVGTLLRRAEEALRKEVNRATPG